MEKHVLFTVYVITFIYRFLPLNMNEVASPVMPSFCTHSKRQHAKIACRHYTYTTNHVLSLI